MIPAEVSVLEQWETWLQACTDRLFDLEGRANSSGTDADRADVAAAFVARKAVAARLAEMRLALPEQYATLAALPITDALGAEIGKNLTDSAELVDAIVAAVDARIGRVERQALDDAAAQAAIDADLQVAATLAESLDTEVNLVAEIRRAMSRGEDLATLAPRASALRARLENAERERRSVFAAWPKLAGRLAALSEMQVRVTHAAAECRDKIADAPLLAVPDVSVLDAPRPIEDLQAMSWSGARAHMQPLLQRVERVEAALSFALERFEAPLRERDELRGLLEGFGRKAAATGGAEDPQLATLYEQARAQLWSAPCNLSAARSLVEQYIAAVNSRISGGRR